MKIVKLEHLDIFLGDWIWNMTTFFLVKYQKWLCGIGSIRLQTKTVQGKVLKRLTLKGNFSTFLYQIVKTIVTFFSLVTCLHFWVIVSIILKWSKKKYLNCNKVSEISIFPQAFFSYYLLTLCYTPDTGQILSICSHSLQCSSCYYSSYFIDAETEVGHKLSRNSLNFHSDLSEFPLKYVVSSKLKF